MADTLELAGRLVDSASPDILSFADRAVEHWGRYCESPIETLLLTGIMLGNSLAMWSSGDELFIIRVSQNAPVEPTTELVIVPQFVWRRYRIDFAVFMNPAEPSLFIECDGHMFHERTPEQAERDRSRDREVQQAGIPILRFTGRELYRDCMKCASDVLEFAASRQGIRNQ